MEEQKKIEKVDGREWRLPEWFADLTDNELSQLRSYHIELIYFNGHMNLISIATEKEADKTHFADAVLASRMILEHTDDKEIFDLGSGNGVPGVIIAILAPERKIYCVDSDARKIEFLKHVSNNIGLPNLYPLHTRIEDINPDTIKVAVSRGLGSISKTSILTRTLFPSGGKFYHMKGKNWVREVAEMPSQICSIWTPELLGEYEIPENGPKMSVVVTRKL